ncbi:MAG TPA: DUF433 domain-containing protein [Ktedonobacteraceae bacterium]|nr:DUF433 domain-containing protein [Ktedonobacteraceae bacterium]
MAQIVAGEIFPGITVDPAIVHGKPAITGTRVPVTLVLGQLAAGESVESVCENYDLTPEQVRAVIGYAAERLAAEEVYVIATA